MSQIMKKTVKLAGSPARRVVGFYAGAIALAMLAMPVLAGGGAAYADEFITMTIDKSTVNLDVAARSTAGTFSKSAVSTVSVKTTNGTGYTIGIRADGANPSKLINSSDPDTSTNSLISIDGATTIDQFKALSATTLNGKWGYMPSRYCTGESSSTCSNNTNTFLKAPTTGDTLDITEVANPTTANTYELSVGARVDATQKLGTYNNTYVIYANTNPVPYSIIYDDDAVGNMPEDVNSGQAVGNTLNLASNTPTRAGYTFIGWCTTQPTVNTNGTDTCSGTTYQPSASITISVATAFHLYAMWSNNYTIDSFVAGGGTMQDFARMSADKKSKIIASMALETDYTVKDSRDNQDYTIAKLKDGNVWMTKNLNLAGNTAISCNTTDCSNGYTTPTNQGWQSDGKLPASSTAGFNQNNYAYVYNSGNATTNCTSSQPCYSYYSWDAATLGSGRSIGTQDTDAPYSICPKGWRLPTSGNHEVNDPTGLSGWKRGDFYRLATAYGVNLENAYNSSTTTFYNNAGPGTKASFLLAGYYSGGQFYRGGARGYYWSATSYGSTSVARNLRFNSGNVYSADYGNRYDGFSVRCMVAE
ncbi:InlB B-repeat-containing protein [Candidatus Saccharibacteria bacterium]|nr:InlB B-repeat-containing protein [Candidatus Saccharibacteria bacterium]